MNEKGPSVVDVLSKASGIAKEEALKIRERVRDNHARLDACAGPHVFGGRHPREDRRQGVRLQTLLGPGRFTGTRLVRRRIVTAWRADEIGQIDGALVEEAETLLAPDPLAAESAEPAR